jgi:CheY-like chemotaxis protein
MQCKVLIVDDDPFLVIFLKLHFSEIGIEIEDAGNGIEALEKTDNFKPDVVLSEITLPRMNGYELHYQLRNNPESKYIPFIFLTRKDDIPDQLKGFKMGVDDYVCKPFEINDLVMRIQRAVERAEKIRIFRTKAEFSGNLSQILWTDIFQLIELNYKTGELLFLSPEGDHIGKALFSNGRLINAKVGHFEGEEAFYMLMMTRKGFFEFYSKTDDTTPAINSSNASLLLQGSRMIEDYQGLCRLLPDLNRSVKLTTNKLPLEIKKNIDNQLILKIISLIHKKQPIKTILNSGDISPIRAASLLYNLLNLGALEIENHTINVIEKNPPYFPAFIDRKLIKIMSKIERLLLTGILEFRNRVEPQAIFFQEGRLVHAFHGKVTGKKALYRILRDRSGFFNFIRQPVSLHVTIGKPLAELLEEGAMEIQKLQKINTKFFPVKLTVNDQKLRNFTDSKIIFELRNFISLIQKHGKVDEIVEHSHLPDSRIYDRINYLLKIGILEIEHEI